AKPIRWVNDTLPPRARARWLLITIRLSQSSFTGPGRTLVAVGTVNDTSMLAAVRAGAPRSTVYDGSSVASVFCVGWWSLGSVDFWVAVDGSVLVPFPSGLLPVFAGALSSVFWGAFVGGFSACFCACFWGAFCPVVVAVFTGACLAACCGALSYVFSFLVGASLVVAPLSPAGAPLPLLSMVRKKSHQALSTLFGSRWYCSYISSTSHSFAPNASSALLDGGVESEDSGTTGFASSGGHGCGGVRSRLVPRPHERRHPWGGPRRRRCPG